MVDNDDHHTQAHSHSALADDDSSPSLAQQLRRAWDDLANQARGFLSSRVGPELSDSDARRLQAKIDECVSGRCGEVLLKARVADIGTTYLALDKEGQGKFFELLVREFDADPQGIEEQMAALGAAADEKQRILVQNRLRKVLIPRWAMLMKHFAHLPYGFKFLIDMRADLLMHAKANPVLKKVDVELKEFLASWFDISLIDLREITWDSPASLLERIIDYEAVHEVRSWKDLKHRLYDYLCFGFFHHKLPGEPLIFVEVALTYGMADNIQTVLDPRIKPDERHPPDTAIFYSISSTQRGLSGISMGNFLIKQVVQNLSVQRKGLRNFVTLSPLPRFRSWLHRKLEQDGELPVKKSEMEKIAYLAGTDEARNLPDLLDTPWHTNPELAEALRNPLMRLCAHYLVHEHWGDRAFDPVAHFHLTNGARIERLNWLADCSDRGMAQSAGIMVNYCYRMPDIDANHERYAGKSKATASRQVRSLL